MTTATVKETEFLTRSIARWGSVAAAIVFGATFLTDKFRTWEMMSDQAVQIALIVAVFVGYALAWTKRFEVSGSVIALAAIVGVYLNSFSPTVHPPHPIFLAVGAPALFHLVAVVMHRYVLPRSKA